MDWLHPRTACRHQPGVSINDFRSALRLTDALFNSKLESTVRYLGIEVDDALEIAEQTKSDRSALLAVRALRCWPGGFAWCKPGFTGSYLARQPTHTVGHHLPPRHHKNLCVSDRSRSTADIARDPSEATKSSLLSFGLVGGLTSRGPWLKVCSHQGRAGAPDPQATSD